MYIKRELTPEAFDEMRINLSVRIKKFSPEPVCDFCGDPNPRYVYASRVMSTGEEMMNWRWCACEACSLAVDSDDWQTIHKKLHDRLTGMSPMIKDSPLLVSAIVHALEEFHRDAMRKR